MTTAVVVLCTYLVWMAGVVMSALGGRWLRSLAPESTAIAVVALVIFVAGLCWPFVVLGCRVRRAGHGATACRAGGTYVSTPGASAATFTTLRNIL